ncbi:KH domain-containing protein [bacterium]|nr:KH domain-containing protein [bacterium]MBU1025131.1 KH domain-containing protein [bacterium]
MTNFEISRSYDTPVPHIPQASTELNQAQIALDELSQILEKMGIKAQVFYQELRDEILLEIRGNNLGLVIGKHGQTLDALEFILNVVHRKRCPTAKQLILDAQGYREKKRVILKKMLYNARDAVVSTNDEVPLDPMSAADRKVIHLLCRSLTEVKSESRGDGKDRRIIILPSDGNIEEETVVN